MGNKTLPISALPPTVESVRPAKPQKTIQDWLREDHERHELKREFEQLKRDVGTAYLWLRVGITMLALVLIMQLSMWFA